MAKFTKTKLSALVVDKGRPSSREANAAGPAKGEVPEYIHIYPGGELVEGRDGRRFRMTDAQAVIQNTSFPLRLDRDHESVRPGFLTQPSSKAYGWVEQSEHIEYQETDEGKHPAAGFWAKVEWTPDGHAMVENRDWRKISPTIYVTRNSEGDDESVPEVVAFESIALTNIPNLDLIAINSEGASAPMPASASEEKNAMDPSLIALANALGLSASCSGEALAQAVQNQMVLKAEYEMVQNQLKAAIKRAETAENAIEEQAQSQFQKELNSVLDDGQKVGKVRPEARQFYANTCKSPEQLEDLKKHIEQLPQMVTPEANAEQDPTPEPNKLQGAAAFVAENCGLSAEEWAKAEEQYGCR